MTWRLTSVPIEDLKAVWPIVAPLLAPAVARSGRRLTMRRSFEALQDGRYLLWLARQEDLVVHAAFLTRTASYPNRTVLAVDCAGGTGMDDWLEAADRTFRAFAADSGLGGVEMSGRRGWLKILGRLGWKETFVVMETDAAGPRSGGSS